MNYYSRSFSEMKRDERNPPTVIQNGIETPSFTADIDSQGEENAPQHCSAEKIDMTIDELKRPRIRGKVSRSVSIRQECEVFMLLEALRIDGQ